MYTFPVMANTMFGSMFKPSNVASEMVAEELLD